MRLEDRTRGVIYVAISSELIGELIDRWSEPVQVMVEHVPHNHLGDDLTLIFRRIGDRLGEVLQVRDSQTHGSAREPSLAEAGRHPEATKGKAS